MDSVFTGWLGLCTGTGPCMVNVNEEINVSATFAPASSTLPSIDIDSDNRYDALTDGLLIVRYMFGLTGTALTSGALGTGGTVTDPAVILSLLDDHRPLLDVDGNGQIDALTDAVLVFRYLFGLRGSSLIQGAVGDGATRTTAADIAAYIQSLIAP